MTLQEVADILKATVHSGRDQLDKPVTSGYASDMLSEVMAHARAGQLWFTVQTNLNVPAVALLLDLGGIVITGGNRPEPAVITKGNENGMVIMNTPFTTFEAISLLCKAGF